MKGSGQTTTKSNKMEKLLNTLYKEDVINSEKVFKAMLQTDRGDFVEESFWAYKDSYYKYIYPLLDLRL